MPKGSLGNAQSLKPLLKFIGYLPDYLSALSRTLLRFFWTTFVETAVCSSQAPHVVHVDGYAKTAVISKKLFT